MTSWPDNRLGHSHTTAGSSHKQHIGRSSGVIAAVQAGKFGLPYWRDELRELALRQIISHFVLAFFCSNCSETMQLSSWLSAPFVMGVVPLTLVAVGWACLCLVDAGGLDLS